MANKTQTIRIESINGGHSLYERTSNSEQFIDSLGINPDSADASNSGSGAGPTVITPTLLSNPYSGTLSGIPIWIVGAPRNSSGQRLFAYASSGSVYTINQTGNTITGIGDLNDGGSSGANGCAYYDNYVYFARETTVARYGPLNGTAAFTDDYWITTLGKPALEQQAYPARDDGKIASGAGRFPNHVMHRHKDGALYFADTSGGQGVIHRIKTTKTTVEGDTDNGSTYNALDLPYGYFVTDIESLGDDLVIAAFEGISTLNTTTYDDTLSHESRAALFFWDTTSDTYYKVIQREFPDQMITALENANGVLYIFSCNMGIEPTGVRLMRYLGGSSFEQITLLPEVDAPLAGGTLSFLNQIRFASDNLNSDANQTNGSIWSIGTQNQPFSNAVFNVAGARHSNAVCYALSKEDGGAPWTAETLYSYTTANVGATGAYIVSYDSVGGGAAWDTDTMGADGNAYWKSRMYVIGSRFKITKVKLFINGGENVSSAVDLRVHICTDMGSLPSNGGTDGKLIGTINQSNYPSWGFQKSGSIILKPESVVGEYGFTLNLFWRGTSSLAISLPIEIEYEIINDD